MNIKTRYYVYGFRGIIKLFLYTIHTFVFFRSSRLIRYPISVRGKKFISFGKNLTTGIGCRIEAFPFFKMENIIHFGKNIEINDYVHIAGIEKVSIGDNVLIASKVYISDIQHGTYSGDQIQDNPNSIPKDRILSSKPVIIEDNVWIGENVSIMAGVKIGKGSIIGANSVVTKNIAEQSIAVGVPAIVVKQFNKVTNQWVKV